MTLLRLRKVGVCAVAALVLASVLLPATTRSQRVAATDLTARIERVENGLLPPVILQGEAATRMKLLDRMQFYKTPGVSIAVINDGHVEWARAYGTLEVSGNRPVTV